MRAADLSRLHPYTKFVFSFVVSWLAVVLDQPVSLLLLFTLSLFVLLLSRPSRTVLITHFFLCSTTVWGLVVSQGLFYQEYPQTVLFCLVPPKEGGQGLCVIKEGLRYGLLQSLRLLGTLTAGLYLIVSTPREVFFRALASFPLPRGLTLMTAAAVRFLPAVAEELRLIRQALRLRGYRPLRRGLIHTLKTELSVAYPLLFSAVRQARDLADTLLTRGFDPLSGPSGSFRIPWPGWEKVVSLVLFLLALGVFVVKLLFWLYLQEVYYADGLRSLYHLARHCL